MWTPEYFVRILDFPPTVEGVTVPNDDGTFDIYLSCHLTPQRREECLAHELQHIFRDHFYSERPVEDLEREADGLPPGGLSEEAPGGAQEAAPKPSPAASEKSEAALKLTPRSAEGKNNEPRDKRGPADFINIFALPDPALVPIFASIADLYEYTKEIAEQTGKK